MWCTVGLAHDTVSHISPVKLPLMTTRQAQSKNKVDHQSTLWVKEDIKLLSISVPYNGWISVQLNTVHTTSDSWILWIAHNVQTTHRQTTMDSRVPLVQWDPPMIFRLLHYLSSDPSSAQNLHNTTTCSWWLPLVSERVNIPIDTLQVILHTSLSRKSLALTTKINSKKSNTITRKSWTTIKTT